MSLSLLSATLHEVGATPAKCLHPTLPRIQLVPNTWGRQACGADDGLVGPLRGRGGDREPPWDPRCAVQVMVTITTACHHDNRLACASPGGGGNPMTLRDVARPASVTQRGTGNGDRNSDLGATLPPTQVPGRKRGQRSSEPLIKRHLLLLIVANVPEQTVPRTRAPRTAA